MSGRKNVDDGQISNMLLSERLTLTECALKRTLAKTSSRLKPTKCPNVFDFAPNTSRRRCPKRTAESVFDR